LALNSFGERFHALARLLVELGKALACSQVIFVFRHACDEALLGCVVGGVLFAQQREICEILLVDALRGDG
jgi:hypothetical protein